MSIIFPSSLCADLMNIALKNVSGTTATTDGATADGLICTEDLSNFVQCGVAVNTATDVKMFINTFTSMLEHCGKTYFETLSAEKIKERFGLRVSADEFAVLSQKVRIAPETFEAAFVMDGSQSSSFDDLFGKHPFRFDVKIWNCNGFYRTKPFTISYEMFKSSVLSSAAWRELVAEMWKVVDAVVEIALAQSPRFLVEQQIANAALYRSGVRVVSLPQLYASETGNTFKSEDEPDFAAWFVAWQRHVNEVMEEPTNLYSGKATIKMNTPATYKRKFLVDRFYDAINKGLSGVYHDDKIGNIDDYELIPYLENVNEPRKLDIVPANPPTLTSGKKVTRVQFGNVVGAIWDKRGTFYSINYRKIGQNPNEFDDHVNYISTVGASHCVDEDSNIVVFTMNKSGKDYTITEEDDE